MNRESVVFKGEGNDKELELIIGSTHFLRFCSESVSLLQQTRHVDLRSPESATTLLAPEVNQELEIQPLMTKLFSQLALFPLVKLTIVSLKYSIPTNALAELLKQTRDSLLVINLFECRLVGDVDQSQAMYDSLQRHPSLGVFRMKRVSQTWNSFVGIVRAVTTCPKLFRVGLDASRSAGEYNNEIENQLVATTGGLCGMPSLKNFELYGWPFTSDIIVERVCRVLKENKGKSLECLKFGNDMGTHWVEEAGVKQVAELLATSSCTLKEVTLSVRTQESILPILDALKSNRSLKGLLFLLPAGVLPSPSSLSRDVEQAIAAALKDNKHVDYFRWASRFTPTSQLDYYDNHNKEIRFYLKLNEIGRAFLLESGEATQSDWVDTIIANRLDHSISFFLLSKNPSLCVS